jgi:hypothetical protein
MIAKGNVIFWLPLAGADRNWLQGANGVALSAGRNISEFDDARWPGQPLALCAHGIRGGTDGDIAIRRGGFEVFAPSLWKPATRPRREINGAVRPGRSERIVPLFQRYLFVRFCRADPTWRGIWRMSGVDAILSSTPEAPIAVPDPAIDAIRSMVSPNGCLYPPNHCGRPPPVAIGVAARNNKRSDAQ